MLSRRSLAPKRSPANPWNFLSVGGVFIVHGVLLGQQDLRLPYKEGAAEPEFNHVAHDSINDASVMTHQQNLWTWMLQ